MTAFKLASLLNFVLVVLPNHSFTHGHVLPSLRSVNYPTQTIAGVTVIDTPLVRDAQSFARAHSLDSVYNHMMRSWLLGMLIINANETLRNIVDLEAHALASLLHDLGLDPTAGSPIVSPNKRFEVDGAIAARNFIRGHKHGKLWDERRLQLVWDAIALHATFGIADYKEPEVQVVSQGATTDFLGPQLGVTSHEFHALLGQFPRGDFKNGFNDSIVWLCQTKPNTTYDTWMQPWGDRYVANYSSKGNDLIDVAIADF